MVTPTDPLYANQWHFALIGNIEAIWNEFSGAGVNVGVYDDGVDVGHEDLAPNYDASLHVEDNLGNVLVPTHAFVTDGHGTACAGLIGAANNGIGGVGVAWGVTLTGVNINFDVPGAYGSINGNTAQFVDLIEQAAANFDVMSNSWGAYPGIFAGNGILGGAYGTQVVGAFETLSVTGRGGLGTIIVQASGNDNEDAGGDGVNSTRFTISVAATEQTGIAADYSNWGASILLTAPAAAVTTDVAGAAGYDPTQYTNTFNGTSAATPVVAGVISLMLDANAGLGWRDVQNILAMSSTLTGTDFDSNTSDLAEDGLWYANASNLWNGGGNHLHTNYGYGMVNAFNAVRMAEVWNLFRPAQTSANEQLVQSGLNDFADTTIGDANGVPFTTTFSIASDVVIEHVALHLNFATTYTGDIRIVLTSADGTEVEVSNPRAATATFDGTWVFGIDSLRGELSAGTWTMQVFDMAGGDLITVRSASLDIFGSATSTSDTYHFTDEFLAMKGFDPARGTVTDNNGGADWLNFAAVAGGLALNLSAGTFGVASVAWGTLVGLFENAVGGDGADSMIGNSSANRLHGMRGADTLNGGTGSDTLTGGTGNDTYVVDRQTDIIVEGTGQGTSDRVNAAASFTLAANDHIEILATANSAGTALINLKGNAGVQTIIGNAAANRLSDGGGTGADVLNGLAGNDIYVIGNSRTTIVEAAGKGTADQVLAAVSFVLSIDDHIERMATLTAAGTSAINLKGNGFIQTITGNAGANRLNGEGGNDTLTGNGGADHFVFSTTLGAANIDTITDFSVVSDSISIASSLFGGLASGVLNTIRFKANATGIATDRDDRILYDNNSGQLYFDSNGSDAGGRVQFAQLTTAVALTHLDFFVM